MQFEIVFKFLLRAKNIEMLFVFCFLITSFWLSNYSETD